MPYAMVNRSWGVRAYLAVTVVRGHARVTAAALVAVCLIVPLWPAQRLFQPQLVPESGQSVPAAPPIGEVLPTEPEAKADHAPKSPFLSHARGVEVEASGPNFTRIVRSVQAVPLGHLALWPHSCPDRYYWFRNDFGRHSNQLISLINAVYIAGALNRTLVLPAFTHQHTAFPASVPPLPLPHVLYNISALLSTVCAVEEDQLFARLRRSSLGDGTRLGPMRAACSPDLHHWKLLHANSWTCVHRKAGKHIKKLASNPLPLVIFSGRDLYNYHGHNATSAACVAGLLSPHLHTLGALSRMPVAEHLGGVHQLVGVHVRGLEGKCHQWVQYVHLTFGSGNAAKWSPNLHPQAKHEAGLVCNPKPSYVARFVKQAKAGFSEGAGQGGGFFIASDGQLPGSVRSLVTAGGYCLDSLRDPGTVTATLPKDQSPAAADCVAPPELLGHAKAPLVSPQRALQNFLADFWAL
eukprot:gene7450-1332_t